MLDYSTVENLKAIVEESIAKAERLESKIPHHIANLQGFSTPKIRHLLNNLCSYGNCKYLEIGVWAGSTLIPALWDNGATSLAIDNYSQFGKEETGIDAQAVALGMLEQYKDRIGRQGIWNGDYRTLPDVAVKKANVFFYDGPHGAEETRIGISKYGKLMADPFILVVDDWELTPEVSDGTLKAFKNGIGAQAGWPLKKSDGYHEGLFVYVCRPEDFK